MRGKQRKLKELFGMIVLCVVCVLCCATAKETNAYANWTCTCSNKENADYDSKCWKCNKYRNMRPEFDTVSGKEFDYGDNVKIKWTGKVGSQGYILAVRNLDTDYRPFYNKELGMYESSYTIKEDLPAGKYKVAIAAVDVYNKQYWCEECIYFYVNPEQEEYVEITSTPVVEDGEVITSFSGTSDYGYAVVTPEEPELGVDASKVGESNAGNNDTATAPDVFVFSPESVISDESTQDNVASVDEKTSKNGGGLFDSIAGFFSKEEAEPEDPTPGEFKFSSPKDGKAYKSGKDVTVKWKASKKATSYTVYLSGEDTGKTWYVDTTSTKHTFKSKDLEVGNYAVFVVARNDYGINVCESLHFSVEQSGKSMFTVTSSGTKVTDGITISSAAPLKITLNSNVTDYSVELVSNTIGKTVFSLTNCEGKKCEISMDYLYPANEYTLTVVTNSGKDGKNQRTDKLSFNVALNYSNIGSAGKFQAPIKDTPNCIITCNKNEYFGESRQAYIKKLASNIEYLIFRAGDEFNETQVKCLRDIYGEMLDTKDDAGNYCLLNGEEAMGQYLEFRFEGAGRDTRKLFKGSAKWNDGSWHSVNMKGHADSKNVENNASKTIPLEFDLFGAMTVVIRNAEVYGVFFRTSTLPDNYLDYPYENVATCVIQDGIYDFYTYQHDWWTESGGFAAFQLENNGDTKIPAIYDELTYNSENGITGEGINIHHNYNSDDKRYSAGCLTVDKDDWAQYMKLYGFAYDKNRENKSWDENGRLMGKIVVKRLIDIKINADSGTYSNVKEEAK